MYNLGLLEVSYIQGSFGHGSMVMGQWSSVMGQWDIGYGSWGRLHGSSLPTVSYKSLTSQLHTKVMSHGSWVNESWVWGMGHGSLGRGHGSWGRGHL